mmetsp:Transcript_36080/g.102141  ORF Transcript_36080/g.102141 Transcript_36080/m.102141 type:complete len:331 (+) Transcript_36080:700-1692(+)
MPLRKDCFRAGALPRFLGPTGPTWRVPFLNLEPMGSPSPGFLSLTAAAAFSLIFFLPRAFRCTIPASIASSRARALRTDCFLAIPFPIMAAIRGPFSILAPIASSCRCRKAFCPFLSSAAAPSSSASFCICWKPSGLRRSSSACCRCGSRPDVVLPSATVDSCTFDTLQDMNWRRSTAIRSFSAAFSAALRRVGSTNATTSALLPLPAAGRRLPPLLSPPPLAADLLPVPARAARPKMSAITSRAPLASLRPPAPSPCPLLLFPALLLASPPGPAATFGFRSLWPTPGLAFPPRCPAEGFLGSPPPTVRRLAAIRLTSSASSNMDMKPSP